LYQNLDFAFTRYSPITKNSDGMDIALIEIEKSTNKMRYCGVNRSIYISNEGDIKELKALRTINTITKDIFNQFTDIEYKIKPNDTIYLFSDGFIDQFGGEKGKKYGSKRFKELLSNISTLSLKRQHASINSELKKWRGTSEQTDDILIFGIKI
jgi:serine phosphatase RsbU (regulator of sigma subunit)